MYIYYCREIGDSSPEQILELRNQRRNRVGDPDCCHAADLLLSLYWEFFGRSDLSDLDVPGGSLLSSLLHSHLRQRRSAEEKWKE